MSYLTVYQTKFIPVATLPLLLEQKRLFEKPCIDGEEIHAAICERIYELEVFESIKSAM